MKAQGAPLLFQYKNQRLKCVDIYNIELDATCVSQTCCQLHVWDALEKTVILGRSWTKKLLK